MSLLFYKDPDGDFLCIDPSTNEYWVKNFGRDSFEGRATSIAGIADSVNTTEISRAYLKADCIECKESDVPQSYLRYFK